jgi:hypothetical protein
MMTLGILPEHFDPRLAKPGPASASSTFDLLKIAPEETGEPEERCAGLCLNLSWETPDFDTFKSCMLGLIGKHLVTDWSEEHPTQLEQRHLSVAVRRVVRQSLEQTGS